MIALWMLAAMALAVALGAAAFALERALRLIGRQGRAPWVAALAAAAAWPLLAPLMAPVEVQSATVRLLDAPGSGVGMSTSLPDAASSWLTWIALLDRPLLLIWLAASLLMLARVAWGMHALHRVARTAPRAVIDQTEVRVTAEVGPAVFALWQAHLLLPHWLLELDARLQRLVMIHEREHVSARDPQLIVASFVVVALMPWNLPVWWLAHRLRTAAELDCDVRVLRAGADAHTYSHLLLLIAQRQGNAQFLPMMADAPSTLRSRITAMSTPRPTHPALRAAIFALVACALVGAAASPVLATPLESVQFAIRAAAPVITAPVPVAQMPQPAPAPQGTTPAKPKEPVKPMVKTQTTMPAEAAKPMKEFTLDKQAVLRPGVATPRYPRILLSAGVTGTTQVMFVVDTSGNVDESSFKVVRTAHQLFVESVKATLPQLKFYPATVGDRPVKQLVQMVYRFATFSRPELDSVQVSKDIRTFEVTITGNDRAPVDTSGKGYQMVVHDARTDANFDPIYFVDGKRTPSADANKIGKERIASIEVFKGEAARAKYGEEGKNGVILITTKP